MRIYWIRHISRFVILVLLLLLATAACSDGISTKSEGASAEFGRPALVMFYTDNWPPWMEMMLIVDELTLEFEGKAAVITLNTAVDSNAQLQADYNLRGHPSTVILDSDGQISHRIFGPAPIDDLRDALTAVVVDK